VSTAAGAGGELEIVDRTKLPYVYSADELAGMFLAAYAREESRGSGAEPAFVRQKRHEIRRIVASGKAIASVLREISLKMPFLDRLHPFYRDLIDAALGARAYKHAVAKIGNAHIAVRAIAREAVNAVRAAPDKSGVLHARRMYRGRIVSLIEDLRPELDRMREIVTLLRKLPSIDPRAFTVVVAGAPNVGKSSFVRCVSTAKPEVAEYPFTTKQIHVGHVRLRDDVVQVIDTPGLLDRPLSERNTIERQAVLALRHLASVILFLVDPTYHSGFSLDMQYRLYREIAESFSAPAVAALNKADLASGEELERARKLFSPVAEISALECRGAGELMSYVLEKYYVPAALERLRASRR
jgi:nucleolar GTP-binding protein